MLAIVMYSAIQVVTLHKGRLGYFNRDLLGRSFASWCLLYALMLPAIHVLLHACAMQIRAELNQYSCY